MAHLSTRTEPAGHARDADQTLGHRLRPVALLAGQAAEGLIHSGAGQSGEGRPQRAAQRPGWPAPCPCHRGAPPGCTAASTWHGPQSHAPPAARSLPGTPLPRHNASAGPPTALRQVASAPYDGFVRTRTSASLSTVSFTAASHLSLSSEYVYREAKYTVSASPKHLEMHSRGQPTCQEDGAQTSSAQRALKDLQETRGVAK